VSSEHSLAKEFLDLQDDSFVDPVSTHFFGRTKSFLIGAMSFDQRAILSTRKRSYI